MKVVGTVLPDEYIASTPFSNGVYYVTTTEIVRYVWTTDTKEAYTLYIEDNTDKIQYIATDEYGEYLCIVYRTKQVLYSRGAKSTYKIEAAMPNKSYIDKGKVISVYKQKICIQNIHDIVQRRTQSMQYDVEKNSRIDK